jgi:hypothetical protein
MSTARAQERPARCQDCGDAPARRLLDGRWVCEGCLTDATYVPPPTAPTPKVAPPEPSTWTMEPLSVRMSSTKWRCVRITPSGRRLETCGKWHRTPELAAQHADKLNRG